MKKKMVFPLLVAFGLSLSVFPAISAAQQQQPRGTEGQQAPQLYQQCQERLKEKPNEEARELCDEGMKLHQQGKKEEAVQKIQEGLAKFKE